MSHSITAEQYARIIAKVYEPDLDWDNPAEFDLLDRTELVASAEKILARLKWEGFVVQLLDDLVLDEFDSPGDSGRRHLPTETDQWEYGAGYEGDPGTGPQWFAMDAGAFTIREAAEREVERYADAQIRLVRRRRPGPWEVCDEQ